MKTPRLFGVVIAAAMLAVVVAVPPPAEAGHHHRIPQVVSKIESIEYQIQESDPPNLILTIVGEVPSAGYTNPRLLRVGHSCHPADGYQAFYLVADPPPGPSAQAVTPIEATYEWKAFTHSAPWLRGVRVYGVGDGVKKTSIDRDEDEDDDDDDEDEDDDDDR